MAIARPAMRALIQPCRQDVVADLDVGSYSRAGIEVGAPFDMIVTAASHVAVRPFHATIAAL